MPKAAPALPAVPATMLGVRVYRARIFTPVADPFAGGVESSYRYFEDGHRRRRRRRPHRQRRRLVRRAGRRGRRSLGETPDRAGLHRHAPARAAAGDDRLVRRASPGVAEPLHVSRPSAKFEDPEHARRVARAFYDELLRNGTLCALIFSTIHREATDIFFEEAERRGFRGIIGKTMMDRNAPDYLLDDAAADRTTTAARCWRNGTDAACCATPSRRASRRLRRPSSSKRAGQLKREFPDAWVHTHISENQNEVRWVQELFPEAPSTRTSTTATACSASAPFSRTASGSLRKSSICCRAAARASPTVRTRTSSSAAVSFRCIACWTQASIVGLGSDIGAGTTPSLFNAMADAYKVQQVQSVSLSPFHLWYLATLGGARALRSTPRPAASRPANRPTSSCST